MATSPIQTCLSGQDQKESVTEIYSVCLSLKNILWYKTCHILSLTSNTLLSLLSPLSETVLEVFFPERLARCDKKYSVSQRAIQGKGRLIKT